MNSVNEACNESTKEAIAYEQNNEHEIRFYLNRILEAMEPPVDALTEEEKAEYVAMGGRLEPYKPAYLVTAVKLPGGAIELAVNHESIKDKIRYILSAYDHAMRLKSNPEIEMTNIMVV